jgi:hypothetical protein
MGMSNVSCLNVAEIESSSLYMPIRFMSLLPHFEYGMNFELHLIGLMIIRYFRLGEWQNKTLEFVFSGLVRPFLHINGVASLFYSHHHLVDIMTLAESSIAVVLSQIIIVYTRYSMHKLALHLYKCPFPSSDVDV